MMVLDYNTSMSSVVGVALRTRQSSSANSLLQLKQVADGKNAVAEHAGRVSAFELLQTLVYLQQHVGTHH